MSREANSGDVYQLILEAIDGGELPAGSRLIETELAERFAVSRTPVREALKRLEAQGVVAADGRRLVVAELDQDQLGELYEVRRVVEGLAARLAARHAAPEEIAVLREMAAEDRALADDAAALSLANKRFHRQLHRTSHNRYLNQLLQGMRRSLALLAATTMVSAKRRREAIAEHEEIIRAIASRDEDAAEEAARQHISNAFSARLRIMAEK